MLSLDSLLAVRQTTEYQILSQSSNFLHFDLPYSICYLELLNVDLGFVFSDPKNSRVPNSILI